MIKPLSLLSTLLILAALAVIAFLGLRTRTAVEQQSAVIQLTQEQTNRLEQYEQAFQREMRWRHSAQQAEMAAHLAAHQLVANTLAYQYGVAERLDRVRTQFRNAIRKAEGEVQALCDACKKYQLDIDYRNILGTFASRDRFLERGYGLVETPGPFKLMGADDLEGGNAAADAFESEAWRVVKADPSQTFSRVMFSESGAVLHYARAVPGTYEALRDGTATADDLQGMVHITVPVSHDPVFTEAYANEIKDQKYPTAPIAAAIDKAHAALRTGGKVEWLAGGSVVLSAGTTPPRAQLESFGKAWEKLKGGVAGIRAGDMADDDFPAKLTDVRKNLFGDALSAASALTTATRSDAKQDDTLMLMWSAIGVAVLCLLILLFTSNRGGGSLVEVVGFVNHLAEGKLAGELKVTSGSMGRLESALNGLATGMRVRIAQLKQKVDDLERTAGSAAEGVTSFGGNLTTSKSYTETLLKTSKEMASLENAMAKSIETVSDNANQVATSSDNVSKRLFSVRSFVEKLSGNVNEMAGAVEQVALSLNTVSNDAAMATESAGKASQTAGKTTETVNQLGRSADKISNIIDLIKGIAGQTNLLALNATIEAASAGEAGRGFAVVANEVKELARQTETATEEIAGQIKAMQEYTTRAVDAINEIVQVISDINSAFSSMAAAVAQQTSIVNEITGKIQQSAQDAAQVTENVQDASDGVTSIATSIAELADHTGEVTFKIYGNAEAVETITQNLDKLEAGIRSCVAGSDAAGQSGAAMAALAGELKAELNYFDLGKDERP